MTLLEDLERAALICRGVRAWMSGPEAQDMATVGDRLRAHAARLREEMQQQDGCERDGDTHCVLRRINGGPLPEPTPDPGT
jgi:hypothetical protein